MKKNIGLAILAFVNVISALFQAIDGDVARTILSCFAAYVCLWALDRGGK